MFTIIKWSSLQNEWVNLLQKVLWDRPQFKCFFLFWEKWKQLILYLFIQLRLLLLQKPVAAHFLYDSNFSTRLIRSIKKGNFWEWVLGLVVQLPGPENLVYACWMSVSVSVWTVMRVYLIMAKNSNRTDVLTYWWFFYNYKIYSQFWVFQSRSHIEQVSDRSYLLIALCKPGFEPSISVTVVECFTNYATASGPTSNILIQKFWSQFFVKKS